jgi:predicted HAD superfamily Cof-like phosphohydrolase
MGRETRNKAKVTNFEKVKEFMETFKQEVHTKPQFPSAAICDLRVDLIEEELEELKDAIYTLDGSLTDVADALTDLLVVVYGGGHAFGLNLDACFDEVHRSNMSKLGENGEPIYREDGKVMKGPNFSEPDLESVLSGQNSQVSNDRKTWQQLVMEEHMNYYNKKHETSYSFEDYYSDVVNEKIDVHYDWKQLLGMKDG